MSGFDGSHAEAAGFAGSAAAAVVARGALCSGRQCRPRPALREPQRQRPMPGQRIVGSGKMARITRELSRKTAAGMQRRPPLCRHSGPAGSIRHPPSILTAGIWKNSYLFTYLFIQIFVYYVFIQSFVKYIIISFIYSFIYIIYLFNFPLSAGKQRRPPSCRHNGPVGSIRHPPSILTAGIPGGASHAEKRQGLCLFRGIPRRAD